MICLFNSIVGTTPTEAAQMTTFWTFLTALGTIFVAILAILGGKLRSCIFRAKLLIEAQNNFQGDLITINFPPPQPSNLRYYYHLKVTNKNRSITPNDSQVLLKRISKKGPDGIFYDVPLAYPLPFYWTPDVTRPEFITIRNEEVFDFGRIDKNGSHFIPCTRFIPNNFRGYLAPNESMQYHLQIVSDKYISSKLQVFEVSWDGNWSDNPEEMKRYLIIKEI